LELGCRVWKEMGLEHSATTVERAGDVDTVVHAAGNSLDVHQTRDITSKVLTGWHERRIMYKWRMPHYADYST
jgi:hypothetical protein